jgi:hypothetical protein
MKMRKFLTAALAVILIAPAVGPSQSGTQDAQKNADKARAALNAMVQALGGDLWLNQKNYMRRGQVAAFFHGNPDLGTTETFEYHAWPDDDRIEVTKHKDVDEMFIGREGWEVTYRGKRQLPKDQVDDFLRRRDHSIETAVKVWLKEPDTILIDEGQHMAENYLADQVTLISPQNDSITIFMDAQTHLPLQRSFQWRDPIYHDKNTEIEEYADYHLIDGFQTPFSITRIKNGEMERQYYVTQIRYNLDLPPDFWNVDQVARKTKGK